jgi:ZF-HD class homeobox domain-containing protein
MPFNYNIPSESDEQEDQAAARPPTQQQQQQVVMKKRFRTKFTQEQKDKMFNFAEKVGWKFQKQEESLVQQFCQEIGVKRRVLKVWMHNNKHNLAKKQLQDELTTANHLPTP